MRSTGTRRGRRRGRRRLLPKRLLPKRRLTRVARRRRRSSSPARPGAAHRSVWAPTAAASNPGAGGNTRAGSPGSKTTRGVGWPSAPAPVGTNASPPPPAAARLLEGTNGASVGGAPLGWTDVLIQQLLLAGVPERLIVEEDGLFPDVSVDQSTGAVKPVRPVRARSSAVKPPPDAGDEMEAAETAAHRVLERWRAESSRDPLLDAEAAAAAAGGDDDDDDERATAARILAAREAVEKADADAIAAIPDEDVAGLIRTEEEAAVVKAMAARRLVQFDADDYYKIIGDEDEDEDDDGDEDGLVPVVKGERAEAETEDGAR